MTAKSKKIGPEKEMSFLDHLEELRWHLIKSTMAIMILATGAFIFKDIIFDEIIFESLLTLCCH